MQFKFGALVGLAVLGAFAPLANAVPFSTQNFDISIDPTTSMSSAYFVYVGRSKGDTVDFMSAHLIGNIQGGQVSDLPFLAIGLNAPVQESFTVVGVIDEAGGGQGVSLALNPLAGALAIASGKTFQQLTGQDEAQAVFGLGLSAGLGVTDVTTLDFSNGKIPALPFNPALVTAQFGDSATMVSFSNASNGGTVLATGGSKIVPEPASLALIALAVGGLGWRLRKH